MSIRRQQQQQERGRWGGGFFFTLLLILLGCCCCCCWGRSENRVSYDDYDYEAGGGGAAAQAPTASLSFPDDDEDDDTGDSPVAVHSDLLSSSSSSSSNNHHNPSSLLLSSNWKESVTSRLESIQQMTRNIHLLVNQGETPFQSSFQRIQQKHQQILDLNQQLDRFIKEKINVATVRQLQDQFSTLYEQEKLVRKRQQQQQHDDPLAFKNNNNNDLNHYNNSQTITSFQQLDSLLKPEIVFQRHDQHMDQWCRAIFQETIQNIPPPQNSILNTTTCAVSHQQTAQIIQSALVHYSSKELQSHDDDNDQDYDHAHSAAWIVHEYTSETFQTNPQQQQQPLRKDTNQEEPEAWWIQYIPDDWIDLLAYFKTNQNHSQAKQLLSQWGSLWMVLWNKNWNQSQKMNPPEIVLQPLILPGACWPMKGSQGFITLAFSYPLQQVSKISLDHPPGHLFGGNSPQQKTLTNSAPKKIQVVAYPPCPTMHSCGGLTFDPHRPFHLLDLEYNISSSTRQTFVVNNSARGGSSSSPLMDSGSEGSCSAGSSSTSSSCGSTPNPGSCSANSCSANNSNQGSCSAHSSCGTSSPNQVAALRFFITENHGNQLYTCLYRILVHGTPGTLES